ncbi:hypothetical protein QB888_004664, partial [Escherichia coli]|nr:hypothetical protein [Escherichia coli]
MENKFDIKSNILSGGDLRVLLNSDHISYGEIHNTLKKKGIFIGDADKSITVPLLSSTLLTPDQFSLLIETSVNRESTPKNKTLSHDLTSDDVDWITPLRELFEDLSNGTNLINDIDNIEF